MPTPISNLPAGQSIFSPAVSITSVSAHVAWDLDSAQNAVFNANESTTLDNPTNMTGKEGKLCFLRYVQNGSSAKTFAFGNAYRPAANLPVVSTSLGAVDTFLFYCTGTTMELINYAQNVGT